MIATTRIKWAEASKDPEDDRTPPRGSSPPCHELPLELRGEENWLGRPPKGKEATTIKGPNLKCTGYLFTLRRH